MTYMAEETNLTESIKQLEAIAEWFENQQDVDVEQGLTKVKEAAALIKKSKARLAVIENEFKTVEKEISGEDDQQNDNAELVDMTTTAPAPPTHAPALVPQDSDEPINLNDIPF